MFRSITRSWECRLRHPQIHGLRADRASPTTRHAEHIVRQRSKLAAILCLGVKEFSPSPNLVSDCGSHERADIGIALNLFCSKEGMQLLPERLIIAVDFLEKSDYQRDESWARLANFHVQGPSYRRRNSAPRGRYNQEPVASRNAGTLSLGAGAENRAFAAPHRRFPGSHSAARLYSGDGHGLRSLHNRRNSGTCEPSGNDRPGSRFSMKKNVPSGLTSSSASPRGQRKQKGG